MLLRWPSSAQSTSSLLWNHSWISLWAPSTESLAWMTFLCQVAEVGTGFSMHLGGPRQSLPIPDCLGEWVGDGAEGQGTEELENWVPA